MSTIDKSITQLPGKSQIFSWEGLGADDTGKAVDVAAANEKTVQISGIFGPASIRLEGSINGKDFYPLTDPQGNSLSKSNPSLEAVNEHVCFIRPNVSGGNKDTKIDVHLLIKFER